MPVLPYRSAKFLCGMPVVAPSRCTTPSRTSVSKMWCISNAEARLMILAANLAVTEKSCIWWVVNTPDAVDQSTTIQRITSATTTRRLYTSVATKYTILPGKDRAVADTGLL